MTRKCLVIFYGQGNYKSQMTLKITKSQREAIARLEYDENWIRAGILSDAVARAQVVTFLEPNADKFTEHYRNFALNLFLSERTTLSDDEFESILKIATAELRKELGESVFHVLCNHNGLSGQQFDRLVKKHSSRSFNNLSFRRNLQRRIIDHPEDADVAAAVASSDIQLQEWLVRNEVVAMHHAQVLAEKGGSKAVRNLATRLVRKLKKSE